MIDTLIVLVLLVMILTLGVLMAGCLYLELLGEIRKYKEMKK